MNDSYFGITDLGLQRQNNEDAFIAWQAPSGRYLIGCVIDGVGGYSGGEIAASIARETVLQRVTRLSGEVSPVLVEAFHTANDKIWQERVEKPEHNKMACCITLAVADVTDNKFYYAHLGDTRLYLFRDGSLVKISHDQSFVGFLEDSGRLSETEAMRHPKRNEINKALGFKHDLSSEDDIETGQSPFLPGDMLLLCSDGLTDLVDKATMTGILSQQASLESMAKQLVDAANKGGGKDNVTVVLLKNDNVRKQHAATKPAAIAQSKKTATPQLHNEVKAIKNEERANQPGYRIWTICLSLVVAALAAVCLWQYLNYENNNDDNQAAPKKDAALVTTETRNPQEIKLQNAIDQSKGHTLILYDTAYKSPVIISRAIIINRDSLHIKAKGNITFQADSTNKSAAFILTSHTKNVLLDSLSFQNFNVGVSGYNQSLQLKNVRFNNCKIPVQNVYGFADNKYITGSLSGTAFSADSLAKPGK